MNKYVTNIIEGQEVTLIEGHWHQAEHNFPVGNVHSISIYDIGDERCGAEFVIYNLTYNQAMNIMDLTVFNSVQAWTKQ